MSEDVYLAGVRLINVQSHTNTLLKFQQGLNVIIAPNQTGKSVFMKATKAAGNEKFLPTKKERKAMIHYGTSHAEIHHIFSDSSCQITKILEDRIIYYYTPSMLDKVPLQSQPFPFNEFLEKSSLVVDKEHKFYANMLDSRQAMLFLETDRSTQNGLVKAVTQDERLEALKEHFSVLVKENAEQSLLLDERVWKIKFSLSRINFVDLAPEEKKIEVLSMGSRVLTELVGVGESLIELGKLDLATRDYNSSVRLSDLCLDIAELYPTLNLSETLELPDRVLEISETLGELYEQGSSLTWKDKKVFGLSEKLLSFGEEFMSLQWKDSKVLRMSENLLSIGEQLKGLGFAEDKNDTIQLLRPVTDLVEVFDMVQKMNSSVVSWRETLIAVERSQKEIEHIGFEVECPIYGRIRHIEDNCIPLSDGLALEREKLSGTG